jgi:DNA (cytosine-5)-methyltransferase 1
MKEIRVFEAFAGYGSQLMALKQLEKDYPDKIKVTPVGIAEIDKYAIQAYKAVHGEVTNYGDISKINWDEVPDFDLFTYSSPCQDFSNAGLQRGGEEGSGTRSSLLWECRRAILAKKPKYLLLENVKALVSKKFLPVFNKWKAELESYGYSNFAQVLNAKDYGIPQNRERIFLVSILGDEKYSFPKPFPLELRLKDMLEKEVDEKYYLSDKTIQSFTQHCERKQSEGCGFKFEPTDGGGYAKCLSTKAGSRQTDNFIKDEQKTN